MLLNQKTRFFLFFVPALVALTACTKPSEPSSAPSAPPSTAAAGKNANSSEPVLKVDTASPDQAVKTWWGYLDLVAARAIQVCKKEQMEAPPQFINTYLGQVAKGDVLAVRTPKQSECRTEVMAREIDEVKTESETRAIVFATIKNATPVPTGAVLDQIETKWRSSGFKFKYLIEKSEGQWKVAQVYRYDESNKYVNKDLWEKAYVPSDKPHVPSYVAQFQ